jgi:hypothetical protein
MLSPRSKRLRDAVVQGKAEPDPDPCPAPPHEPAPLSPQELTVVHGLNWEIACRIESALRYADGQDAARLNQVLQQLDLPVSIQITPGQGPHVQVDARRRLLTISSTLLSAKNIGPDQVRRIVAAKITDPLISLMAHLDATGQRYLPYLHQLSDARLAQLISIRRCFLQSPDLPRPNLTQDPFSCLWFYPYPMDATDSAVFSDCLQRAASFGNY